MQTDETATVPAGVTALAEQRGLGAPAGRRDNGSAAKAVMVSLSVAVAGFAASFGLFYVAGVWFRPLIPLAVLALAVGICGLGWAIVLPIRGSQSVYLYDHGIVHVRNGLPRAVLWTEVDRLEVHVIRDGDLMTGMTSAYLLHVTGRAPMRVQPDSTHHDPFGTTLVRLVSDAGRPVVQKLTGKR